MRAVLQRVSEARVATEGVEIAAIGLGLLVLAGVERGDTAAQAAEMARKLAELRIFPDADGRMQHDVRAARGRILLVSQFTLVASLQRGRRPSFDAAAPPAEAEPLIALLAEELVERGVGVECGRFGAHMQVELCNDGPVTFVLEVSNDPGP